MKKILLILSLTLSATFLKAQDNKTKFFLYGNIGGNYSTFYQSSANAQKLSGIIGPQASISLRTEYPTLFGFETGVGYSTKGGKFSSPEAKVTLNEAYIFWDGLYYFALQGNNEIIAGAGLYAGGAFSGKVNYTDSVKTNLVFGDTYKRFDGGIELKSAFNWQDKLTLGLNYQMGVFRAFHGLDLRGQENNGRNSVLTLFLGLKLYTLKNK